MPPGELGKECLAYLAAKNMASPADLQHKLSSLDRATPCVQNVTAQQTYHPDPKPSIPGAADTTDMSCRYGNPSMWGNCGVCCGLRPHFNWVVSTCEETQGTGQFCQGLPKCVLDGSPKINYVAAYQFDGSEFVLMDDSSVGELSREGIAGDYRKRTGWEAKKAEHRWVGGDWTTKYAPWASGGHSGPQGPRGVTPPAGMWVLSAENFYYAGFYMLSQLGINLEGKRNPTGTNCWMWELDPVEGTAGWAPGKSLPGNLNMLYSTNNAQASGCMPMAYGSEQANGFRTNFTFPEDFRGFCASNPEAEGCRPWKESISWSGGALGSHRFENLWDEPYVFAIVVDSKGYWIYRWRPAAHATQQQTGWPGLERFKASRRLPARPAPVKDPRGLRTDVAGDVAEAVILQPSLPPENSCLRASVEQVNWQFGADALGAIANELGQDGPGQPFEGAQNWWSKFSDTQQNQGYPMTIAGVERSEMPSGLTCNVPGTFTCSCAAKRRDAILSNAPRQGANTSLIAGDSMIYV